MNLVKLQDEFLLWFKIVTCKVNSELRFGINMLNLV